MDEDEVSRRAFDRKRLTREDEIREMDKKKHQRRTVGSDDAPEDLNIDEYDARREARRRARSDDRGRRVGPDSVSRGQRKKGRSIVEKEHIEGLLDEGALHSIQQASDKAMILKNRLAKAGDRVSPEQMNEIMDELEEYMQKERIVAFNRQDMTKQFHSAKDIEDKEERRAFLDGLKEKKEERKNVHKAARDEARAKYLSIKEKVDALLAHKEL